MPFHNIRPTTVAVGVLSGDRPERPAHPALTDDLWALTKRCWNQDQQQRPDISEVDLFLRTTFRCGDNEIPDDTTLGSFRGMEASPGEFSCSSRRYDIQRDWKCRVPKGPGTHPRSADLDDFGSAAISLLPPDPPVTRTRDTAPSRKRMENLLIPYVSLSGGRTQREGKDAGTRGTKLPQTTVAITRAALWKNEV